MITPSRGKKLQFEIYFYIYTIILQKIGNQAKTNVRKFFRDDGQLFKRSKYKKSNSGFARRKRVSMLIEQNILYVLL